MKIPLKYLDRRLEVLATFMAHGYHARFQSLEFVVDTGTNRSMIGYGDATKLGIPVTKLKKIEASAVGGHEITVHEINRVDMGFLTSDGTLARFSLDKFCVMVPTKKGKSQEEAKRIPSLLGMDFLEDHKLSLYCNPARNVAYFEDV